MHVDKISKLRLSTEQDVICLDLQISRTLIFAKYNMYRKAINYLMHGSFSTYHDVRITCMTGRRLGTQR